MMLNELDKMVVTLVLSGVDYYDLLDKTPDEIQKMVEELK